MKFIWRRSIQVIIIILFSSFILFIFESVDGFNDTQINVTHTQTMSHISNLHIKKSTEYKNSYTCFMNMIKIVRSRSILFTKIDIQENAFRN